MHIFRKFSHDMVAVAIAAALLCAVGATAVAEPVLTIDAAGAAGRVGPLLYGLMTEEINHSYDGGLYAELIRNRAFLDSAQEPVQWSIVQANGSRAQMTLDPAQPLSDALSTSLRLDVRQASADAPAGVANGGYWGISIVPGTRYRASFYARAASGYHGVVTLALQSNDGQTVFAGTNVGELSTEWKRYEAILQTGDHVTPTTAARYVLAVDRPGRLWVDLVSLFPPTWNDRPNGLRKDLMQMLVDLHPKFLRFPGGNFVEGGDVSTRFQFKQTIGPLIDRPGHPGTWGYRATDGMGMLEFLEWCQDMRAEPVLAIFAGYTLNGKHIDAGPKLQPFVQEALDEIEYVTGDRGTPWGARRAKDGHSDRFPLHYVEIGNEDFFDKSGSYDARFTQFYDAIKAKYPTLKLISTIGNEQTKSMIYSRTPDAVDEHYYLPADEFTRRSPGYYEDYRRAKRPEVFVGEWASYEDPNVKPWDPGAKRLPPTPNFKAALGDAAWMLALERNSDLVSMNCYAPMLVNVNPGAWQWRPDLIGYNAGLSFGSPSYYAIRMFSTRLGNQRLAVHASPTSVQASATRDSQSGEIFIKLVNPTPTAQQMRIVMPGVTLVDPTVTVATMAADPNATNSLDRPGAVVPVTSSLTIAVPSFEWTAKPNSIAVITVKSKYVTLH